MTTRHSQSGSAGFARAGSRRAGRGHGEQGDTLIEILIAIVVIGIVGSASFFAISVGATNSKTHRDSVTADQLLRNSAEATKAAVRTACANGGTTYSVAFSTLPAPDASQNWHQYYEVARGFTIPSDISNQCPPASGPVSGPTGQAPLVSLSITMPDGVVHKSLNVLVRTP